MSNTKSGFSIERRGLELRFRHVALSAREWLAPDFVRVRLTGSDLAGFDSPGADDHMRLFFPSGPTDSVEELRASPSREYTPLAWGDDWLDVEFAVHGDQGVAAPWRRRHRSDPGSVSAVRAGQPCWPATPAPGCWSATRPRSPPSDASPR